MTTTYRTTANPPMNVCPHCGKPLDDVVRYEWDDLPAAAANPTFTYRVIDATGAVVETFFVDGQTGAAIP